MISLYLLALPSLIVMIAIRHLVRRIRQHSIANLPGPSSNSWVVGNLPALISTNAVGEAEFLWVNSFGNSLRIKGTFGSDVLFTADPKALQYILNTSGYNFPKSPDNRTMTRLVTGHGMVWAEGAQHSRHRRIMNPAFSYAALRVFLPLFRHTAQRTVMKWKELIAVNESESAVIDIPGWMARLTLDAMGSAAFDYEFGATNGGSDNELANSYSNLFVDSFLNRSDYSIAFEALWGIIPEWMFSAMQRLPIKTLARLHKYMKVARGVAKSLVDRQIESHTAGKEGGKDVMSILVRANLSEDPKNKMGEDELLSQMTTLMLAGHDTTAATVTWALYELSKHPELQRKIREEIAKARVDAAQRGEEDLSISHLDSMKYILAVIKETLRYHPIGPHLPRMAGRDDVIPLSTPQRTNSGEMVTSIPVSKGQRVLLSLAAYNRLKPVWGEDADTWRPERFLEEIESGQKTHLGVLSNIATFSSGLRGCIGWRFALIEMQAMLIELIEHFHFLPPPGNIEIVRAAAIIMTPMVKGSNNRRAELPLTVTPVM